MKPKVTELKRIGDLIIFVRGSRNRTYLLRTDRQLRRVEQLIGDLLINKNAHVVRRLPSGGFRLVITKNIQQA